MQDFAKKFYKSKAWTRCRAAFLSSKGHLCERCLQDNKITPADTVHHKILLTPYNIDDPLITLEWSNLMAVCRDCHAAIHSGKIDKPLRYKVDDMGRVIPL